jgi:23S rRNA (adenine1618-N6)-methyltransferase
MRRRPGSQSKPAAAAPGLHPRNRHQGHYDFAQLVRHCPALAAHLIATPTGQRSIDFGDAAAVRHLNQALLAAQYGIAQWQIPPGYLCPPIPGRADYLHGLADLLASGNDGDIPRGAAVRVLDIGTGASAIYPLLGNADYGWRFLAVDIDAGALASAERIIAANPGLAEAIELRRQPRPEHIFAGLLRNEERFELSLCNPPFHASAAEARAGSQRKWRNLGKSAAPRGAARLNFGGQSNELVCPGGEAGFLRRMIEESRALANQVLWFSSLVSKAALLPGLRRQLQAVGALEVRVVSMAQGNKQSRFVAWTFLEPVQQTQWRLRWKTNPS